MEASKHCSSGAGLQGLLRPSPPAPSKRSDTHTSVPGSWQGCNAPFELHGKSPFATGSCPFVPTLLRLCLSAFSEIRCKDFAASLSSNSAFWQPLVIITHYKRMSACFCSVAEQLVLLASISFPTEDLDLAAVYPLPDALGPNWLFRTRNHLNGRRAAGNPARLINR